ncbi:hypothetical protein M885DRAFT_513177 [Pelagophyceae sp. CCMP2097]|nr:hypothetical protein M885DRAFT_513177 [Pelagophyceae sp. CCMP2097]|mmetsp:Transcript_4245/g.14955  ORF Transcript_4245/g.14955 Transcript_4245/m.14955 type:complete len:643 (-) Transcript_4245:209-2137(-)
MEGRDYVGSVLDRLENLCDDYMSKARKMARDDQATLQEQLERARKRLRGSDGSAVQMPPAESARKPLGEKNTNAPVAAATTASKPAASHDGPASPRGLVVLAGVQETTVEYSFKDLQRECKARGLKAAGKKNELKERLDEAIAAEIKSQKASDLDAEEDEELEEEAPEAAETAQDAAPRPVPLAAAPIVEAAAVETEKFVSAPSGAVAAAPMEWTEPVAKAAASSTTTAFSVVVEKASGAASSSSFPPKPVGDAPAAGTREEPVDVDAIAIDVCASVAPDAASKKGIFGSLLSYTGFLQQQQQQLESAPTPAATSAPTPSRPTDVPKPGAAMSPMVEPFDDAAELQQIVDLPAPKAVAAVAKPAAPKAAPASIVGVQRHNLEEFRARQLKEAEAKKEQQALREKERHERLVAEKRRKEAEETAKRTAAVKRREEADKRRRELDDEAEVRRIEAAAPVVPAVREPVAAPSAAVAQTPAPAASAPSAALEPKRLTPAPPVAASSSAHLASSSSGRLAEPFGAAAKVELKQAQKNLGPMDTYEISDREESTDEESGDEEDKNKPQKHVPAWASGNTLKDALRAQTNLNPSNYFPVTATTCELKDIFKSNKGFKKRTSSQNWAQDLSTFQERQKYRIEMGFSPPKK